MLRFSLCLVVFTLAAILLPASGERVTTNVWGGSVPLVYPTAITTNEALINFKVTEPEVVVPKVPTPAPTAAPTGTPTSAPTGTPTGTPTSAPTGTPTASPTQAPTGTPTAAPTKAPTGSPTPSPTGTPTSAPTAVVVLDAFDGLIVDGTSPYFYTDVATVVGGEREIVVGNTAIVNVAAANGFITLSGNDTATASARVTFTYDGQDGNTTTLDTDTQSYNWFERTIEITLSASEAVSVTMRLYTSASAYSEASVPVTGGGTTVVLDLLVTEALFRQPVAAAEPVDFGNISAAQLYLDVGGDQVVVLRSMEFKP